jgi:hypothetical protein
MRASIATKHQHNKINNFAAFKNWTGACHRWQIAPNQDTLDGVSKVMVLGRVRPTIGSGQTMVQLGKGPITYLPSQPSES